MKTDELLKYMPDYYNGVYEMGELLKAQSKGLYQFDGEINRTLLNEFIIQADEKGISVFEDQYGIVPEYGDSLELRRQRVLTRTLTPQPLTIRRLKQIFESLKIPAEVSVDHSRRVLNVVSWTGELTKSQQKLVIFELNTWLPANMGYTYRLWAKTETAHAYIGSACAVVAQTVAKAEWLDDSTIVKRLYQYGIWGKTNIEPSAYVAAPVTGRTVQTIEAERRNL